MKHPLAIAESAKPQPDWLTSLDVTNFEAQSFPAGAMLSEALYYPACGTDGGPVAYLGGLFHAYMYVDYAFEPDELGKTFAEKPFKGYACVAQRALTAEELGASALENIPFLPETHVLRRKGILKARRFFARWCILQRDMELDAAHGPQRLALLFICHDGVRTYYELYRKQGLAPKGLAIIQPGHGFGGNWCNFESMESPLYLAVMLAAERIPQYLLHGGYGASGAYPVAPWREFNVLGDVVKEVRTGSFRIWQASVPLFLARGASRELPMLESMLY